MINLNQEPSHRIAIPLPLQCERELLRLHLWSPSAISSPLYGDQIVGVDVVPAHLSTTATCLDLLPDDPVHRINSPNYSQVSPEINHATPRKSSLNGLKAPMSGSTPQNKDLQYRYAIIRSDYVDSSNPSSGYYFVQFRSFDVKIDQAIHPDLMTDGSHSSHKATKSPRKSGDVDIDEGLTNHDYILFEQIMKGYRDGLTKSATRTPSKSSSLDTELSLLSTVCRWRSCLSESCTQSTTNSKLFLCSYHSQLKKYLDEEYTSQKEKNSISSSIAKESSKYLPKKVNYNNVFPSNQVSMTRGRRLYHLDNQVDRDLLMITSSCTLIHELWDGKLQLTLNTFANKVCSEFNSRKRIQNNLKNSSLPFIKSLPSLSQSILSFIAPPEWSKWRNEKEYQLVSASIETSSLLIQRLVQIEKEITIELHLLSKLKIFPSAELIIIKKEMKSFREKNQSGDNSGGVIGGGPHGGDGENDQPNELLDHKALENELYLAEKKLSIIRGRRIDEEETRMAQKKRIAKAKQIDEMQSKDPLNFRNQTRY